MFYGQTVAILYGPAESKAYYRNKEGMFYRIMTFFRWNEVVFSKTLLPHFMKLSFFFLYFNITMIDIGKVFGGTEKKSSRSSVTSGGFPSVSQPHHHHQTVSLHHHQHHQTVNRQRHHHHSPPPPLVSHHHHQTVSRRHHQSATTTSQLVATTTTTTATSHPPELTSDTINLLRMFSLRMDLSMI